MQILEVSRYSPTARLPTSPTTRKTTQAASSDSAGNVVERSEYDAYGSPAILDASHEPRATSHYKNAYLFQRKRLDLLDSGGLKLMSWPYKNFDHIVHFDKTLDETLSLSGE
jgi:hypothetical protein